MPSSPTLPESRAPEAPFPPDPVAEGVPGGADGGIPILLKTPSMGEPPGDCAYLVTRDGMFLSRRHRFFDSCVPVGANSGPASLASQRPYLRPRFPRIPRRLFGQVLAFARSLWRREGAEVIVFFTVDASGRIGLLVPPQTAVVRSWRGDPPLPVRLSYRLPDPPPGTVIFGDIHSHGAEDAYASWMDVADEQALTGLHLVVGRLDRANPEFHVEATIDGFRFSLAHVEEVLEPPSGAASGNVPGGAGGGLALEPFPAEWANRVTVRALPEQGGVSGNPGNFGNLGNDRTGPVGGGWDGEEGHE